MDWEDSADLEKQPMADDGTGAGLRIPALLIGKSDGDKLLRAFIDAKPDEKKLLMLNAEFITEYKWDYFGDQIVKADFWYNPSDDKALDFIKDVARYIEPLSRVIEFEPKIAFYNCQHCAADLKSKHCVSDGRYCGIRHSDSLDVEGKEIIMEGLREYCLAKHSTDENIAEAFQAMFKKGRATVYFEYIKRIHSIFRSRITEESSMMTMKALTINTDIIKDCVKASFANGDPATAENWILADLAKEWKDYGIYRFPALFINKMVFKGHLSPDNVFEAVCASFSEDPAECRRFQLRHGIPVPRYQRSSSVSRQILGITIVALLAFNCVVIYFYRKYINAELNQEMTAQVQSSVSQYIALSQVPELHEKKDGVA